MKLRREKQSYFKRLFIGEIDDHLETSVQSVSCLCGDELIGRSNDIMQRYDKGVV